MPGWKIPSLVEVSTKFGAPGGVFPEHIRPWRGFPLRCDVVHRRLLFERVLAKLPSSSASITSDGNQLPSLTPCRVKGAFVDEYRGPGMSQSAARDTCAAARKEASRGRTERVLCGGRPPSSLASPGVAARRAKRCVFALNPRGS
uniref:Uncharacterized protein n=1 Tax=Mycena chlorophos TaxID=658473 RepID=A0ABQ0LNH5_MYCCL|nr:predicted protein [Mycena chlorophos]